jgi:TFIIF-interacting CTD phosphatase-like protein
MRKRYNIILDIDNTLLHAIGNDGQPTLVNRPVISDREFHIYPRPYLKYFLQYLFDNYNVAVWSAGNKEYVDYVTQKIITTNTRHLDFVFNWDQCKEAQLLYKDSHNYKNLKYIWDNKDLSYLYNQSNTILIDDRLATVNPQKNNCILIREFDATDEASTHDLELLKTIHQLPI